VTIDIPAVHYNPRLRYVCAWCKQTLSEGPIGAETSHGLCPRCAAEIRSPRLSALVADLPDGPVRKCFSDLALRHVEITPHQDRTYRGWYL
jgi:DNA-directed RNA polymerase subunit RPC12/RpoP